MEQGVLLGQFGDRMVDVQLGRESDPNHEIDKAAHLRHVRFGDKAMRCEIRSGELLFVPVGWWHFVEALDVSATLTFTNFRWDNDFYRDYPREWT